MVSKSKIAVIGAGFVGSTTTYALAMKHAANEIVLIDILKDKASGEVDDIKHGMSFLGEMDLYAGDYSDVKDCDLIIITAGANRKPGETRIDLAKKNAAIAKSITDEVMKYYNGGVILVVSNPVDILTYLIAKWTGLPKGRVIGTGTTLDSARFRSYLADYTGVDVVNVHGYIVGEHGDSQVAVWSNTHIAGTPIDKYCAKCGLPLTDEIKQNILEEIKTSGASIIKRKGATFYGIATCVSSLANSIMQNKHTLRTVSHVIDGQFGITGVAVSLPVVLNANGASDVFEPEMTAEELEQLHASANACKEVIKSLEV